MMCAIFSLRIEKFRPDAPSPMIHSYRRRWGKGVMFHLMSDPSQFSRNRRGTVPMQSSDPSTLSLMPGNGWAPPSLVSSAILTLSPNDPSLNTLDRSEYPTDPVPASLPATPGTVPHSIRIPDECRRGTTGAPTAATFP